MNVFAYVLLDYTWLFHNLVLYDTLHGDEIDILHGFRVLRTMLRASGRSKPMGSGAKKLGSDWPVKDACVPNSRE